MGESGKNRRRENTILKKENKNKVLRKDLATIVLSMSLFPFPCLFPLLLLHLLLLPLFLRSLLLLSTTERNAHNGRFDTREILSADLRCNDLSG